MEMSLHYVLPDGSKVKRVGENRPSEYYVRKKERALERLFGITQEEYNKMFEEQNGLCAICKSPPKTYKKLSVDHDGFLDGKLPKRDTVRALLCHTCNTELGILEKDLDKNNSRMLRYREKYLHRREGAV